MALMLPRRHALWLKGVCIDLLKKLWPNRFGRSRGMPAIVPAWVYSKLCEESEYEPELLSEAFVPHIRREIIPTGKLPADDAYRRLWARIDCGVRYVFIIGDSDDRVSVFLEDAIKALALSGRGKLLIVWTGDGPGPSFQQGDILQLILLRDVTGAHEDATNAVALGRALIEARPATIYVASSGVAWTILRTIGLALSEHSRLFSELPDIKPRVATEGVTEAEKNVARGLPRCVNLVAASKAVASRWADCYGVDSSRVSLCEEILPVAKNAVYGSSGSPFHNAFEGLNGYGE